MEQNENLLLGSGLKWLLSGMNEGENRFQGFEIPDHDVLKYRRNIS